LNRVHLQTFLKTTFCKNIQNKFVQPAMEAPPQKNAIAGLYSVGVILVAKEIEFVEFSRTLDPAVASKIDFR